MPLTEIVLRTPRLVVTVAMLSVYFPFSMPRVFRGDFWTLSVGPLTVGSAIYTFLLVAWSYSLVVEASKRMHNARHPALSGIVAMAAVAGLVVAFPVAHALYYWPGDPPLWMLIAAFVSIFVGAGALAAGCWMASSALIRLEWASRKPSRILQGWTWFAIACLGIGIWFIYGRVKTMLSQPIQSEIRI